ncbi:DUF6083 domain-containing protein [Streptomyces sp. NPDC001667]
MGVTNEPPRDPSTCPECEFRQDRHPTGRNGHVLLEHQRHLPARDIPAGHHWLVRPDGTATNIPGAELPADTRYRFPHRLVCPCGTPPSTPALKALWDHNSGLTAHFNRPAAESG